MQANIDVLESRLEDANADTLQEAQNTIINLERQLQEASDKLHQSEKSKAELEQ